MMNHKLKSIIFLVILISSFSLHAKNRSGEFGEISYGEGELKACRLIVKMISTFNYKKVPLNDSLSCIIFDRYVKSLDPNRIYFIKTDLDQMGKWRLRIDEDLKNADLQHIYQIYNIYKFRYENRLNYATALLSGKIDLEKKEYFFPERKLMPFISTISLSDQYWKKKVKYDLLTLETGKKDKKANTETLRKRYQNLVKQSQLTNSWEVFQLFMDAYIGSIDPHAAYFIPANASEFNSNMSRSLEGIGVSLSMEDEQTTIKGIISGGPAAKTGMIDVGDKIIAIKQGNEDIFQDVVGWKLNNVISLIKGPKGSSITLKILKAGKNKIDRPYMVNVVREKIIMNDQSVKYQIKTMESDNVPNRIAIISIPAFYQDYKAAQAGEKNYKSTTRDVQLILDTLKTKSINGIMLDLRGNGGGSLSEAVSLSGLFIKSGPVVQTRNIRNEVSVNNDNDGHTFYDGPLAILVDRTSASASEIFSAAMQDYKRAIILGTQTYGKGTVQTPYSLDKMIANQSQATDTLKSGKIKEEDLGQLNITTNKFYRITGSSTQHKGVSPDISLPSYISNDRYGEDTEPSALPWDTINPRSFTFSNNIGDLIIRELSKKHLARQEKDAGYKAYQVVARDFTESEKNVSIPLNQTAFNAIQNRKKLSGSEHANLLRTAMDLPSLKIGEKNGKSDDIDYVRKEALQILSDYILLTKNPRSEGQSSAKIKNN